MRGLFARMRCAVESYVESYVESSVEPRCKRRFEYVKVVPLSRNSTGLRHCSVMIKWWCNPPWSLSLLSLLSLLLLLLLLLLPSSALSKLYPFFFRITRDLNRHFGATSASLRIEGRASKQPLCSQALHRLWASTFDININRNQATSHWSLSHLTGKFESNVQ